MSARRRTILSIFSIIFLVVLIFITWFDWNMFKPFIERQVTEKTGRDFMIQGDLDVDLSINAHISAEGISLANADCSTEQPMLSISQLAFRVSLWDLLSGHIVLPEVLVSQPKIILETIDGKRNWDLKKEKKEAELPRIDRLTLDHGILVFRDPEKKTDITAKIFTEPSVDARETPIRVSAEGTFTELEFRAQA